MQRIVHAAEALADMKSFNHQVCEVAGAAINAGCSSVHSFALVVFS